MSLKLAILWTFFVLHNGQPSAPVAGAPNFYTDRACEDALESIPADERRRRGLFCWYVPAVIFVLPDKDEHI